MSAPDEPIKSSPPPEQPPPPGFRPPSEPPPHEPYAARLDIDYPEKLDRLTTFFRLIWIIPIVIILSLLSATSTRP